MANPKRRKPATRRPNQPRKTTTAPRRAMPVKPRVTTAPPDSTLRTAVAGWSRAPMIWLSRQPKFLIPAVMLALILTGLLAPVPVAVVALVIVVAFVGWLGFLSWPVLSAGARGVRAFMISVLILAIVGRIAGWL
jgi:uncharacterized protein DUF6703